MRQHATRFGVPMGLVLLGLGFGGRAQGQAVARPRDVLLFENATVDAVRVYVVSHGSQWRLGRVDPGRTELLTIPQGFAAAGEDITVLAIPISAERGWGMTPDLSPDAIRSVAEPARNLPLMHWRLVGQQLYGVPRS
jgi:hypothetical protein